MKILLAGDINLVNVADPSVPFAKVVSELKGADVVLANLECCFYEPPAGEHSVHREGFYAALASADALPKGGIHAVGIANNVNYGTEAIRSSIAQLDRLKIPHTGAGNNLRDAKQPVIIERNGVKIGFIQRTSVYWPINHEAAQDAPGVAVIRGQTAYQIPLYKDRPEAMPLNRPGVLPIVVTWGDHKSLQTFRDDITELKAKCDIVVASCHWGLEREVLEYMQDIGRAGIDAGADVVFGHGPHYSLPIEVYKGKPIYYGVGSFSFHTGHGGIKHGDWVGMLAKLNFESGALGEASFQFVRHNEHNESVLCKLEDERKTLDEIATASRTFGTTFSTRGDDIVVDLGR